MKKLIIILAMILVLPFAGFAADEQPEYVPVLDGKTFFTEGWSVVFSPYAITLTNGLEPLEQGWAIVQYGASSALSHYRYYPPLIIFSSENPLLKDIYFVTAVDGSLWNTNGFFLVEKK